MPWNYSGALARWVTTQSEPESASALLKYFLTCVGQIVQNKYASQNSACLFLENCSADRNRTQRGDGGSRYFGPGSTDGEPIAAEVGLAAASDASRAVVAERSQLD